MSFFEPKLIDQHALKQQRRLRSVASAFFDSSRQSMDQLTDPGTRVANRFTKFVENEEKRLTGVKKRVFWKIAPDGLTILRVYSGDEPLEVD